MAFAPILAAHRKGTHKGVIEQLREAGAVRRDAARPLPTLPGWQRRRIQQLIDRGVIRKNASGAYYIDESALSDHRGRQRTVAFGVIMTFAGIVAALVLTAPQ